MFNKKSTILENEENEIICLKKLVNFCMIKTVMLKNIKQSANIWL